MDSSYVMIVLHIPPWIKKEYFVRLGVEHLPKGLPLLPSLLLPPPLCQTLTSFTTSPALLLLRHSAFRFQLPESYLINNVG